MNEIIGILQSRLGAANVLTGDAVSARATSYWDAAPTTALAMVFVRTTEDVSFVLAECHRRGQKVVTQGGLTGCVQGAVAGADTLILAMEKMNRIASIDAVGGTAVVESGAVLQAVQEAVAECGMVFPLDLGARGSCTIGGNVSTNAGGINVIRYGMMRNLVLGLEAVLADGTVLSSMNAMLKNNAGYDLKQLFIGTEGTLGVVTRVVLRLFPAPSSRCSALVAMSDFTAVTGFLQTLQGELAGMLLEKLGPEGHAHFVEDWRSLVVVVDKGDLRPGRLRARKPEEI